MQFILISLLPNRIWTGGNNYIDLPEYNGEFAISGSLGYGFDFGDGKAQMALDFTGTFAFNRDTNEDGKASPSDILGQLFSDGLDDTTKKDWWFLAKGVFLNLELGCFDLPTTVASIILPT